MKPRKVATLMLESLNDLTYRKAADKHFAKKAVLKDVPTGRMVTGPGGMLEYIEGWLKAIPDARIEILDQWDDDEVVETRFVLRGTFSGALPAAGGGIVQGSGQKLAIEFTQQVTVKKDKVRSAVNDYDLDDLMDQLELDVYEDDIEAEDQADGRIMEDAHMDEKTEMTESEVKTGAVAEEVVEAEAEEMAEVEAEVEAEVKAEDEAEDEAEAETEEEAEAEDEMTDAEAEDEVKAEVEDEVETEEDTETEAEVKAEAAKEAEAVAEAMMKSETEAGTETAGDQPTPAAETQPASD